MPHFKSISLVRIFALLLFVFPLSGCILQNAIGHVIVAQDGATQENVAEAAVQSGATVAVCAQDGYFYQCYYIIDGEFLTSTVELLSEFYLLGVLIDPLIVQVPADVTNITATFDDGSGAQPALVAERAAFEAEPGSVITAEVGTKFLIVELPPSVVATLPRFDAANKPTFNFALNFEQRTPLSQPVEPIRVKAMLTGKVTVNGHDYFAPLFPCVRNFADIPAVALPISDTFVNLQPHLGDLFRQGLAAPCQFETYDYSNAPPPQHNFIYLPNVEQRFDVSARHDTAPIPPEEMSSTIFIVNPESSSAVFTLRVYDAAGAEVYTTSDTLIGNGARTIALPSSLGPAFRGSAVIETDDALRALTLDANDGNTARALREGAAQSSQILTFPYLWRGGSDASKSILAIQNTSATFDASVILHYSTANGVEAIGSPLAPVNIPPRASASFDSQALFGASKGTYSVRVESNQPLAGAQHLLHRQDTAALRGLTNGDQGTELYLNGIARKVKAATGKTVKWSELYVNNHGAQAAQVTATFYRSDGTVAATTDAAIPARGVKKFSTKKLDALGNSFKGFVRITQSTNHALSAIALAMNQSGSQYSALQAVPRVQAASEWVCADTRRVTAAPKQFTQFHILNADTKTAQLEIQLYDPTTGAQLAAVNDTLAAGAQLNLSTKKNMFSALGANYSGLTRVRATNNAQLIVNADMRFGSKGVTSRSCAVLP